MRKAFQRLSLEVATDAPPTEFRIFTSGVIDTVKGEFLFDSKAAKLVLAEYQAHGIDLMIDYDHASLGSEYAIDPAQSGKAAGWFNLEVRGGELWAVNVRWTPPAADALKRKEWRFMSPAFSTDKDGRVTALLNVALTNIPATRRLTPLVAASKGSNGMDSKLIQQALEAIEKGDAKTALDILKGLIASAAGADPAPSADDPGSENTGEPPVTDIAAPPPPAPAPAASDADEADDANPAKKGERKAMRAMLRSLTGSGSFAEALGKVEEFRTSHLALETERKTLAAQRATLESAERRKLVTELVQLGAEFPATVFADDKATVIKPRWLKMPIEELRSSVVDQKAARGNKPATGIKPPKLPAVGEVVELSADELRICVDIGCDPKIFAALKVRRDGKA